MALAALTEDENIHELTARWQHEFPSIDLLVHSAGAISIGPLETAPVEELDR